MQRAPYSPELHIFVCANQREPGSPLGAGCGDDGEGVYSALKSEVARRRLFQAVWVTKTHCLGVCPRRGAAVARYPEQLILTEVLPSDAPGLLVKVEE